MPERTGRSPCKDSRQHQIVLPRRGGADLFHGDGAVLGGIDLKAVGVQNLHGDLAVQLVILGKQDVLARKVGGFLGQYALLLLRLLPDGGHQGVAQVRQEHRLGAERRDTGGLCLGLNVGPVIGGQDNNRRIIV